MDSALRPRDIQARIRAGESPEEVANAAGVPLDRIDAFAAPVLAERDYIASLARANPVRRRGETSSHRTLRNAVADTLASRGLDVDEALWDAWKLQDRRWQVQVTAPDGASPAALFVFEAVGRFSVAANDEGRTLIGDGPSDDLALVDATRDASHVTVADARDDDDEDATNDELVDATAIPDETTAPHDRAGESDQAAIEHSTMTDGDDTDDAFQDGDLTEVDGVYDIVAPARGDLDVLYDMLSSFDEDSVKIYAGLVHPKDGGGEPTGPIVVEVADVAPPEPAETGSVVEPAAAAERPAAAAPQEPEQLSLIDEIEEPAPRPKPRTRRKRAAVPSWDEIMFGAPHTPKSDD